MANFVYKAVDPSTRKHVSINISAANQNEANRLILERGLRPMSVKEVREGDSPLAFLRGIKRKERVLFTTQISTLLSAGLPLLQSLETSADQTANKELKKIIRDLIVSIESGITFSDALAKYPRVFDNIFVNLVKAGEASGALDTSLQRLAVQQEKDGALIDKLKNALVYPIIVSVVMVMVVVFMLVFVLPKVENFYANLEGQITLPLITQILLATSDFVINFWYLMIGIVFGAVIGLRYWMKSNAGISVMDQVKLKAPVIKNLYQNVYMARFSRTIGTLFGAGVNLIQSLEIIQEGINNIHVERSLTRSTALVQEGTPLSASLRQNPHFTDLIPDMIQIGEQSGQTEEMLLKAASYYESEVEKALKTLSTLLEPIMILTLGGVAISIILAILLPIYSVFNNNSNVF